MKNKILIWLLIVANIIIFLWSLYNVLVYMNQASNVNVAIFLIIGIILLANIGFLIKSLIVNGSRGNKDS